jgi:hypothetical protein
LKGTRSVAAPECKTKFRERIHTDDVMISKPAFHHRRERFGAAADCGVLQLVPPAQTNPGDNVFLADIANVEIAR